MTESLVSPKTGYYSTCKPASQTLVLLDWGRTHRFKLSSKDNREWWVLWTALDPWVLSSQNTTVARWDEAFHMDTGHYPHSSVPPFSPPSFSCCSNDFFKDRRTLNQFLILYQSWVNYIFLDSEPTVLQGVHFFQTLIFRSHKRHDGELTSYWSSYFTGMFYQSILHLCEL